MRRVGKISEVGVMDIKLDYVPLENQLKAHLAIEKHILYGGAVGGGKSVFLVNDALRQSLGWAGNRVGIFRWQFSEFKKTTYQTMRKWILDIPGLVVDHNQQEHWLRLCNGSEIIYGGIKPSASVSGDPFSIIKSLEVNAVYIDELTDFPEDVYLFICTRVPRIRATNVQTSKLEYPPARVAASCNPHLGWVKHRWVDQQLCNHIFIPSKVTDNIHLSPTYEKELREIWKDNPEWIDQYLEGNWEAVIDFGAIFPSSFLLAAKNRQVPASAPVVFGVDVATWGDDTTVVTERRGMKSEIIWERKKQGTMDTANQVAALADARHPERIIVDYIGVGSGVHDRLAEMGYPSEAFVGGAKAYDERYKNRRAEAYFGLRRLLEQGRVDLPNDSELINEMGAIQFLQSQSERTIQVESKMAIRKRLGKSPDKTDSIVYAYADAGEDYVASGLAG